MIQRTLSISPRLLPLVAVVAVTSLPLACRSTTKTAAPAPATPSADTWAVVDGKEIPGTPGEKVFPQNSDPNQALSQEEALSARLSLLDDLILEEIMIERARQQTPTVT